MRERRKEMLKKADHRREKRFVANQRILNVDFVKLRESGVSLQEFKKYFPRYIISPTILQYGWLKRIGLLMVQWFLRTMVNIFLKPRHSAGSLEQSEIDEVYTREADTYDRKHHLTTHGMDLVWRRMAGWFVSAIGRNKQSCIKVLDLCTGTGLAVKEIYSISQDWGINAEIIGLDYNEHMLAVARNGAVPKLDCIKFIRGDAANLAEVFDNDLIDVVVQIFGIGGIPEPLRVFNGVLKILKPGGQFLMIDMHKPIPEQSGELPFCLKWFQFPILEIVTYEETTIPLVLNRLWGWRDTTLCFYVLPLITYQDNKGRHWGFEVKIFEQESQRWWFALPLMSIARIIVEKTEISEEVASKRKAILEACVASR